MPAAATFVSQFTSLACWQTHPRIDRPTIFAGPKIHPALVRFAQAMAKASIEVILSNANGMRRTNCDERSRGRPRDIGPAAETSRKLSIGLSAGGAALIF